jgi:hypothetical protein
LKTREEVKTELLAEKIPGCSEKIDENPSVHFLHTFEWVIESLVDARLRISQLEEYEWMYKELCK